MKLLAPLGLLGLIGVIILIVIYLIKPNFQQKHVSSTYIWKQSLKYKKQRVPVSNLRNFLLILCQILIISLCSFLISRPNSVLKEQTDDREIIAIIDSSASMRTQTDDFSRFERAADKAIKLSSEVFSQNGVVSVMIADEKPYYLFERARRESEQKIAEKVKSLVANDSCSYGSSDVDGAIALCEDVLSENPEAKIYLFTDSDYAYVPSAVTVENVQDESEWNAAILDAYAEIEDNYYTFYVEAASYGRSTDIELEIVVSGANASDKNDAGIVFSYSTDVSCPDGIAQKIVFRNGTGNYEDTSEENETIFAIDALYSYQRVSVIIKNQDSFSSDNAFFIYGGQKEPIKVQYYSEKPNTFVPSAFYAVKSAFKNTRDIVLDEVKKGDLPLTEGYDLYIFEHTMPEKLPADGAVFLINPATAPAGSGLTLGEDKDLHRQDSLFSESESNYVKGITTEAITITKYRKIISHDPGYEEIMSVNGDPVYLVKNEGDLKIAVLSFSLHYSNITVIPEWMLLVKNLVNEFLPAIVNGNAFEVNEKVTVNTRGESMLVSGNAELELEEFPATLTLNLPGTYDLSQTTYFGKLISESIYVRIPASESNIRAARDGIAEPYRVDINKDFYKDLLVYFALALVIIEFFEWFLKSREGA